MAILCAKGRDTSVRIFATAEGLAICVVLAAGALLVACTFRLKFGLLQKRDVARSASIILCGAILKEENKDSTQ